MNSSFSAWCAKVRSPEPIANPFIKLAVNVNYNRGQGRGAGNIPLGQPTIPPPAVPVDLNAFQRNPNYKGRVGPTGVIGEDAYQRMQAEQNAIAQQAAAPAAPSVVTPDVNDPSIASSMAVGPETVAAATEPAPVAVAQTPPAPAAAPAPTTPAAPAGPGMGRYWSDNLARTAVNAPANAWKAFSDPKYNYTAQDSIVQRAGKAIGGVMDAGGELAKGLGAGVATLPAAMLHDAPAAGLELINAPGDQVDKTLIGGLAGRGLQDLGMAGAASGPQPITGTPTAKEIASAPVGTGVKNQFAGLIKQPKPPVPAPQPIVQNAPAPSPVTPNPFNKVEKI